MFNNPYLDPVASIVIGLLLAALAVFLGKESGALLVGERTNRAESASERKSSPPIPQSRKSGTC